MWSAGNRRSSFTLAGLVLLTLAGLVLLTLAGCAPARPGPAPVTYQLEPWRYGRWDGQKLTTAHYEVYTTVTDRVLVETFPELIERAYAHYQQLVPPAREPQERMSVYLFATRAQWAGFTRQFAGPRAATLLKVHNGGYSERGVSVMQYVAHQITFPLLAHEGLHQYLHYCVSTSVPAWVNEGLAVMCEGQRWTSRGLEAFDPWYNPARRNQLAESLLKGRLYSLRELLTIDAGTVVEESNARIATYYAQVWTLALFLSEGADGKHAAGFRNLLQALGAPELDRRLRAESIWSEGPGVSPGEALFRCFITDDLETCEREYVAFLRKRILNER